jgi:hypothetical protein
MKFFYKMGTLLRLEIDLSIKFFVCTGLRRCHNKTAFTRQIKHRLLDARRLVTHRQSSLITVISDSMFNVLRIRTIHPQKTGFDRRNNDIDVLFVIDASK